MKDRYSDAACSLPHSTMMNPSSNRLNQAPGSCMLKDFSNVLFPALLLLHRRIAKFSGRPSGCQRRQGFWDLGFCFWGGGGSILGGREGRGSNLGAGLPYVGVFSFRRRTFISPYPWQSSNLMPAVQLSKIHSLSGSIMISSQALRISEQSVGLFSMELANPSAVKPCQASVKSIPRSQSIHTVISSRKAMSTANFVLASMLSGSSGSSSGWTSGAISFWTASANCSCKMPCSEFFRRLFRFSGFGSMPRL